MQWAVELGEFNIKYQPRTVARRQVLADSTIEIEDQQPKPEKPTKTIPFGAEHVWIAHIDGSSNKWASDAGIVLVSPNQIVV